MLAVLSTTIYALVNERYSFPMPSFFYFDIPGRTFVLYLINHFLLGGELITPLYLDNFDVFNIFLLDLMK